MEGAEQVREALERNVKAVTLRPAVGQGTAVTKVRLVRGEVRGVDGDGLGLLGGEVGELRNVPLGLDEQVSEVMSRFSPEKGGVG